ncbi:MAG: RluA family pseudouridine synthase [Clostridia bacterium]|nr:RluA family pseudouridine synthase [Clostridia bacterium]
MKNLIVNKKYDGKKLNTILLDNFNGLSLNTIYKALRKKDIRINNIKTNENCTLHEGDEITIYIRDEFLYKSIDLNIIYEDENIIVVNKPQGIEIVSNHENEITLTKLLLEKYSSVDFPAPCHRLDRNTYGLVLFAKNKETLDILLNKFKNNEIEKHYNAKVYGIPKIKEQTLEAYLFKDSKKSLVYISDEPKKGYQKITTSYKVSSENKKDNTSILDVTLHTGRTHQIRAHFAHIGYPIIGDRKIWIKRNKQKI